MNRVDPRPITTANMIKIRKDQPIVIPLALIKKIKAKIGDKNVLVIGDQLMSKIHIIPSSQKQLIKIILDHVQLIEVGDSNELWASSLLRSRLPYINLFTFLRIEESRNTLWNLFTRHKMRPLFINGTGCHVICSTTLGRGCCHSLEGYFECNDLSLNEDELKSETLTLIGPSNVSITKLEKDQIDWTKTRTDGLVLL